MRAIWKVCLLPTIILFGVIAAPRVLRAEPPLPYGPILDDFGHDLAPFAPAEVSSFDGGPDPNNGFFFDYRRLYWNVSRPDNAANPFTGDFTWGNRFDIGFMNPDTQKGLLVEVIHVSGPSIGGPLNNTTMQPDENVARFTSIEADYQWRWDPLHDGSTVESFIGVRYADLQSLDALSQPLPNGQFTDNGLWINNNMIGPVTGFRYYKRKDRFTWSVEGRGMAAYNHQVYQPVDLPDAFEVHQFVPTMDLRIEGSYSLAKAFAITVGWEGLYMGRGIARAASPFSNQDVLMTGINFGVSWNR